MIDTEFIEFKKIPRLSRDIIISEKLDGSNSSVYITELDGYPVEGAICQDDGLAIFAGSRTRWLNLRQDNYGFARWVIEHKDDLYGLGPGRHFGEFWGIGVQRNYGLKEKRFSLFNTIRWCEHDQTPELISVNEEGKEKWQDIVPECCHVVPVLYKGEFDTIAINNILNLLAENGSYAAPGFLFPEGIIIYHSAGNIMFKKTILRDEEPKSKMKK